MVYKYELNLCSQFLNNKFGCFIKIFNVFESILKKIII